MLKINLHLDQALYQVSSLESVTAFQTKQFRLIYNGDEEVKVQVLFSTCRDSDK